MRKEHQRMSERWTRLVVTVWGWIKVLRVAAPEIPPGAVQNEKIENPETLPQSRSGWTISRKNTLSVIRFLFYANGHFTSCRHSIIWTSFESKQNSKCNHWLHQWKRTCIYGHTEMLIVLFSCEVSFWAIFFSIFHSFRRTNNGQN